MSPELRNQQMQNGRKSIQTVNNSSDGQIVNNGVSLQYRKRTSPETLKTIKKGQYLSCESPNGDTRYLNSSVSVHHSLKDHTDGNMVSGGSPNQLLQRKDVWSRKYVARRNLMGHLYARQPPMKRSYSFVAGEKPPNESIFPQLQRKQASADRCVRQKSETARKVRRNDESSSKKVEKTNVVHRSGTEGKISLPELINDINMSARLKSGGIESVSSNEQDELEDSNGLRIHSGKVKTYKYRPITPGLIDKLNKLRLSSRCRTEQWINALPLDHCQASHILENYREIRPVDNSVKEPAHEWIYSD